MKRSKNPSWGEAIAKGLVSQAQADKARLTPPAARFVPSAPTPQDVLTEAVEWEWPQQTSPNYRALTDSNFELDIAFPVIKLGVEVDGWENHGKHKAGFLRDRKKDRLLLLAGWRVLRFAASEIMRDMPMVIETIAAMREMCRDQRSSGKSMQGTAREVEDNNGQDLCN